MDMNPQEKDSFHYTYSAKQQEEIARIRQKYAPPEEDKLDASVTRKGMIVSLTLGIASTLILGIGMCCVMVWDGLFIPGIFIGMLGILGMIAAYPVYTHITQKQREKLAPEILRLTDELTK